MIDLDVQETLKACGDMGQFFVFCRRGKNGPGGVAIPPKAAGHMKLECRRDPVGTLSVSSFGTLSGINLAPFGFDLATSAARNWQDISKTHRPGSWPHICFGDSKSL